MENSIAQTLTQIFSQVKKLKLLKFNRFSFPILLLILFQSVAFGQEINIPKQLESVLTQLHQTDRFNGTVLYAEKGKVLYKQVFGVADIRTGKPLKTDSAFNLASVSKQFVATCIMILAEKGKLGIDDDVIKFLIVTPL